MSENSENISEEIIKEPVTKKDPKRVEQGKRLAAISKQAKEDKMRKKIKEEEFSYFPYIVYTVAGLSTFGFVYLLFFGKKDDPHPITVIRKESPKKQPSLKKQPSPKKQPKKFEGFD